MCFATLMVFSLPVLQRNSTGLILRPCSTGWGRTGSLLDPKNTGLVALSSTSLVTAWMLLVSTHCLLVLTVSLNFQFPQMLNSGNSLGYLIFITSSFLMLHPACNPYTTCARYTPCSSLFPGPILPSPCFMLHVPFNVTVLFCLILCLLFLSGSLVTLWTTALEECWNSIHLYPGPHSPSFPDPSLRPINVIIRLVGNCRQLTV